MKKLPLLILSCTLPLAHLFAANQPILSAGYNADIVVENSSSHFAHAVDGNIGDTSRPAFFEAGLEGNLDGLPVDRIVAGSSGTIFELQPYGENGTPSNNSLRLFDGSSETLVFTNPAAYSSLSILAFTSSGSALSTALNLIITFTDDTTFQTTFSAPDWAEDGNAIDGLARSGVSGTGFIYDDGGSDDFGMTETIIDLTSHTQKEVKSLTFTGADDFTTYTTTNVMAVSGTVVPEANSFFLVTLGCYALTLGRRYRKN